MIDILLVDDHPSVMEGTKLMLEQERDISVTLENNPHTAFEIIQSKNYDLLLFDMHMPELNGLELAKNVLSIKPNTVILIYTGYDITPHIRQIALSGISGFIAKTASREQLVTAIRCALRGETVLPITLLKELLKERWNIESHELKKIENKEVEILNYIAKGKSNKEIAEIIRVSQRSLEYTLTQLFQKLQVKSRMEAVSKSRQLGLIAHEYLE